VLDAAASGGALSFMRLRMPPGTGAPPHRHHRETETLLVREGDLRVRLAGEEERALGPGEAVFLPLGSLHEFRSEGGAAVDVIAVPGGLEEFFRVLCAEDPDAPPPPDEEVRAVMERLGLDFSGT
jgi:mannose-6-phosphate isomerase-like protein (cupin superfamily)